MTAWFYILKLRSGKLYSGATNNLEQRYKDHCSGNACRTTQYDSPVAFIHSEEFRSFSDARKREAQIKRWTKAKKEALIAGDLGKLKLLSRSKKRISREEE
jgi:putative endonuclease